jgi:putative glutathione S-transferase
MGIKDQGWPFASIDNYPGAEVDPLYNSEHVKDLYLKADPDYSARFVYPRSTDLSMQLMFPTRFSVPVLWDKENHTIVNNESSEIIRIFNSAFNDLLPSDKANLNIYPANFQTEIDQINEWIYPGINSTHTSALPPTLI